MDNYTEIINNQSQDFDVGERVCSFVLGLRRGEPATIIDAVEGQSRYLVEFESSGERQTFPASFLKRI